MATATANPTVGHFQTIKAWLEKSAALPEKDDGGAPATTGARDAEYKKDLPKLVKGQNVDQGSNNPVDGDDKPVADSGLATGTAGKLSVPSHSTKTEETMDGEGGIKGAIDAITAESAKLAAADLSSAAGLDQGLDALVKAAAALPALLAAAGVPAQAPAAARRAGGVMQSIADGIDFFSAAAPPVMDAVRAVQEGRVSV
jgi:hypothetical protein